MIYVFSNRNIVNDNWLGNEFGNENIRVAKYNVNNDKKLTFYTEKQDESLPSVQVIEEVESIPLINTNTKKVSD